MATITERETGASTRYDVRYRDPEGRQRRRSFAKKALARHFATTVEADLLRGCYVDAAAESDIQELRRRLAGDADVRPVDP